MFLEVEPNPNCEGMDLMRFKALGPPRRLKRVRVYDRRDAGEWCDITGWSSQAPDHRCPASVIPIEDSGLGMAYLVYGGDWGLRLRPVDSGENWDLASPAQWGESHLILSSAADLCYADEDPPA